MRLREKDSRSTAKRATAVRLSSGEEIVARSSSIVSNIDPRHLIIDLLGTEMVGPDIVDKMKLYEWGDSVFVMFVALESPVNYKAGEAPRAQSAHVHLTRALSRLLRAGLSTMSRWSAPVGDP